MPRDKIEKKSNSIQLKDWGPLCNFTRLTHLSRWRREKGRERRRIITRASLCPDSWYMSAHHIEGRRMLQTPLQKGTKSHWKAPHALTTSFIYRKTRTPLNPRDSWKKKKPTSKTENAPWPWEKKKMTPMAIQ